MLFKHISRYWKRKIFIHNKYLIKILPSFAMNNSVCISKTCMTLHIIHVFIKAGKLLQVNRYLYLFLCRMLLDPVSQRSWATQKFKYDNELQILSLCVNQAMAMLVTGRPLETGMEGIMQQPKVGTSSVGLCICFTLNTLFLSVQKACLKLIGFSV